ncbi:MAG: hypothetical protein EA397_02770 [Deltaproteobacteria bacterium]|nr:MAG: hypothetical protein EA397_02770 [Deltaproteobacteria bacterium]
MRVALASNAQMGLALYRALSDSSHQIVALVRDGRSGSAPQRWIEHAMGVLGGPLTLEGRALTAGLPLVWLSEQDESEARALAKAEPDLLLVANFGLILKPRILAVPKVGAINIHWSLLPRHRGPNPSTSVLLAGDPLTGVTFHVVTPRIDAGDILEQVAFPVGPDATATSLHLRAVSEAERRIVGVLDRVEKDGLVGVPQDLSQGSYFRRLTPEQAFLDLSQSAESLDRKVRALISPLPRLRHGSRLVYVSAARAVDEVKGTPGEVVQVRPHVVVACGVGGLAIQRAWTTSPPGPWPAPWIRLRVGDRLS